jgi:transposase
MLTSPGLSARSIKETAMEVIHLCCCGLDVHKETVVACVRRTRPNGGIDEPVRTFATTTAGLLELGDWLVEQQATIAAMESTGVYWKPVWNLLESRLELMLVDRAVAGVRPASGQFRTAAAAA